MHIVLFLSNCIRHLLFVCLFVFLFLLIKYVSVFLSVCCIQRGFFHQMLFCFALSFFSFVYVFNNRGNIVILFLLRSCVSVLCCVCMCVYECKFPKNENGGPSSVLVLVKRRASIRRDDLYFVVAACFLFS